MPIPLKLNFSYFTIKVAFCKSFSSDDAPTEIVNVPGSTTFFICWFRIFNSLKPIVKVTVLVSPGSSEIC